MPVWLRCLLRRRLDLQVLRGHLVPFSHSITCKVLFSITAAVNTWAASLACRNILFHCDNLSVVHTLSSGTRKCTHIITLLHRQVPGRLSCGFPFSNACKTSTLGQLQVDTPHSFVGGLSDSSHCTYNRFFLGPLASIFATHLAQRIKPESMNVYLAAVSSLHISHGLSNPLQPGLR
ncbi:unnamed protein product [Porites evermanni]|uniref:Secreted protein n=1 Tax=Porites evermanni TaxID=104178 RepID=A0ABN8SEV4_9CNID|nr:unnamed protein product [Porites evermanni]